MPNTYTQIHIQFVFAVKNRTAVIAKLWKDELYKYMTGIVQNKGHKLLAINGVEDHIHILVGLRPNESISDLIREVKSNSSKWVNEKRYTQGKFEWQEGYGAFSYSKSQVSNVISYIENQEEHHRKTALKEEYLDFLKKFEVEYDEQYIFKDLE
ncbi:MAG: putative transposase [Pseudoalteromonas distincta]|jgi:putative transposase